jgi:hypothetical protein
VKNGDIRKTGIQNVVSPSKPKDNKWGIDEITIGEPKRT